MRNDKKNWIHVAAGTVILLLLGVIYAWSIFKAPLNEIFPDWTLSQLSLNFTISMAAFCFGGLFSGQISKKYSAKAIIRMAAVLLAIGFIRISGLDTANSSGSLIMLYLFYGVFCGFAVGMGYNEVISTVTRLFPEKPGLISGIMLMGFGFGGMILGSLVDISMAKSGVLYTFKLMGIIIPLILFLASMFMNIDKSKLTGDRSDSGDGRDNYSPREMLAHKAFWVYMAWNITLSSAGLLVINSAANIATAFGASAALGLIVSIFNGGGRVLFGYIYDKLGRKKAMTINSIMLIVMGIVLLSAAKLNSLPLVFIGLILAGTAYGGDPSITSTVINKFFGPKYYPVNFSIGNFAVIPGAIIGPYISGVLQDKSGDYNSTFALIIGLGILAFIINMILKEPEKR